MSNEKDIRKAVKEIYKNYFYTKDYIIIDEYTSGSMNRRADLAVFTKNNIDLIEIKSDKDNFSRLEGQVNCYKDYANNVILVVDVNHIKGLDKYSYLIDDLNVFCFIYDDGIIYKYNINKDVLKQFFYHKSYMGYYNTPFKLANTLWVEEAKQLISFIKGKTKIKNNRKQKNFYLYDFYTINELNELCYKIIYNRMQNKINSKDKLHECGKIDISLIKNKDYKQIIFNQLYK